MKKLNVMIWLAALMLTANACKDDDNDGGVADMVSERDRTFMLNAADGGMFEVKAGELAVSKGDSTYYADSMSVRSFGQMMITDHNKANEELKSLASQRDVSVPTTLSAMKQQKLDSLSSATGAAFRGMYARMMVSSHQETVNLFQSAADGSDDGEVKNWASGKLPTLKHHLEMAEMMEDSIR